MRLSFVLPATMVIAYFVACNAAADFDKTKNSVKGSPDLVRSLDDGQIADAAGRRFLREHKEKGASTMEERMFNEWRMKSAVKKLAREMLKDSSKETEVFKAWVRAGYSLDQIKTWLNPDAKEKYRRIYNGYVFHKYQN